jgi:hypothetical protein
MASPFARIKNLWFDPLAVITDTQPKKLRLVRNFCLDMGSPRMAEGVL